MTNEELTALREKIDNSPGLKSFENKLATNLMQQEEHNNYGIDPLTILFIISIILQVISLCLRSRSQGDVELDVRNAALLPPRKLMRLKRRLNVLWAKHCETHGIEPGKTNPFFNAAVSTVRDCQQNEIADIVQASN